MPKEKTTPVLVRFASALLDSVDSWRRIQKDLPTRPEAIRRLVLGPSQFPKTPTNKRGRQIHKPPTW